MPVPVRKYWIQRYNKRMKEQSGEKTTPDTDRPLTDAERIKFIKDAQKMSNQPLSPGDFMGSRRNLDK